MAPLRCSRNGHERVLECPLCQGTKAGGLRERHPNDTHTHTHIVAKGTGGSSVDIIQPRNTSRLLLLYVHFQFKWLLMKELMVRPSAF